VKNELPLVCLAQHGETAWSLSGRHTGLTDLPLTERGEWNARALGERLKGLNSVKVFTSSLQRVLRTGELAGFNIAANVDRDLLEWNYGQYEGLRTAKIHAERPAWQLFRDGCPGGESPDQVGARADRVVGRVLAARWLGLEAAAGRFLLLSTANMSALGYEHNPSQPGHPTVGRHSSCGLVTRGSFRDMAVLAIAESWRKKLVGAGADPAPQPSIGNVELGKALAQRIVPELESPAEPTLGHHGSTNNLIRRYRKLKEA
jgi:probable phosphoglycerate mutase